MRNSVLAAVGVCLLTTVDASAATHTASSCNSSAVITAVNAASHGDTVNIPAGTCTWNSQVVVTKGITLMGAGIDRTILVDNVPKNGSPESSLIHFDVGAPQNFRFSGLTIRGGAPDATTWNKGHVKVTGSSKALRIDHIKFENQQTSGIRMDGDMWGVVDHCEFNKSFDAGVIVSHASWGGSAYGDGSWAVPVSFGTEQAIYIEDNVFRDDTTHGGGVNDCFSGGRMVIRNNHATNSAVQGHGTETTLRERGCRSIEVYRNTFVGDGGTFTGFFWRSGPAVIFENTFTGISQPMVLSLRRDGEAFVPWGTCNGSSPYDGNTSGQGGYRCVDQPGAGTSRHLNGLEVPTPQPVANTLDPIYQWGNTHNGNTQPVIWTQTGYIRQGRDYYDNTPRPGYTPYVYPHPLVSGATAPPPAAPAPPTPGGPAAPTNIRIIR